MTVPRPVLALAALLAVVALAIGGYQLGWWLEEEGANRRTEINHRSTARQTALVEEVLDKHRTVADIDVQLAVVAGDADLTRALTAQRAAITAQLCDAWAQITDTTPIPPGIANDISEEC